MKKKIRILFVCSGNICRSPLAHRLFEKLAKEQHRQDDFMVDSCGTGAWHVGHDADERMQDIAQEHGWHLDKQARQIQLIDIDDFDHIYVMDAGHITDIQRMLPTSKHHLLSKVQFLRVHDPLAVEKDKVVPDPYYGGSIMFYKVYQMIERSCKHLLATL